jgi:hypothetical protein
MNGLELQLITQRVERLERQNRRFKVTGSLVGAVVAAVAILGQARSTDRVIEAQRFVIKDSSNRPRGVLAALSDGSVLSLYDRDGRGRASLTVAGDGTARLGFFDKGGKGRIVVDLAKDGDSMVGFYGPDAKARGQVRVTPDGTADLGFFDNDGNPIWPGKLLLP